VAGRLRCPYHGWTYRLDGSLATVPAPRRYEGTGFDPADPKFHLASIGGVASYRGFVFGRLAADGPDLEDFLGDAARTLDNMVERSPEGRLEIVGSPLRYLHDCNWKMWVENLNDALHPMVAHASVVDAVGQTRKKDDAFSPVAQILAPAGASYDIFDQFGITVMDRGHSYMGGKRSVHTGYSEIPGYLGAMQSAWGEDKTDEILAQNRHNTVIYPSLTAKDAVQVLRVVKPLAVDKTVVESWHFRLVGAPNALLQRTLLYSQLVNSSASMVGPDDWECYTRMQEGLSTGPNDWVDTRRGLDRQKPDERSSFGTSDLVFRNQYRAWATYMAPSNQ
jgi:phenylpropionate dioxygenase-like ring-hydroxylating dioxygenase large terminal subunit